MSHNHELAGICRPPPHPPPLDPDPALPHVMYVLVLTALYEASACASCVLT